LFASTTKNVLPLVDDDDDDVVADCDFFAWNEVETATFALADN
jgi:hypothetical protein